MHHLYSAALQVHWILIEQQKTLKVPEDDTAAPAVQHRRSDRAGVGSAAAAFSTLAGCDQG
jgi:hypothetical protein